MKKLFNNLFKRKNKQDEEISANDENNLVAAPSELGMSEETSNTDETPHTKIPDSESFAADDATVLEETSVSDEAQTVETATDNHGLNDNPVAVDESEETSDSQSKSDKKSAKIKKPWSLRKKIIVSVAGFFGVLILGAGIFLSTILIDPMSHFQTIAPQTPAPVAVLPSDSSATPTPVPTLSEYDQLVAKSDFGILEKTVNIMLIGVDYAPERADWKGKHYYHSDVMIVLAINKETGSVNLISLPRDTYAEMPGIEGIYKLNASMDCGGGWKDNPEGGCEKVCEAASWMMGGIPINYYYAVDMAAVKGLVNAIDGVDFNIDVDFKMQGREYKAGMQHMDGQAVLDYLRVRKELGDESGDLNRINRQKNMLVAIVQKLKDSGLILKIPDIINAFTGNLVTNVDLASTGALAAYAYQIDTKSIKMYSMGGSTVGGIFNWNFVITNQKNREQIIKEVYGFDITNEADVQTLEATYGIKVPSYSHYSRGAAMNLWNKMQNRVTKRQARPLLDNIKAILDADAQLPDYVEPQPVTDPVTGEIIQPAPVSSDGYRRYPAGCAVWDLYNRVESEYADIADFEQFHLNMQDLCSKFGISKNWEKYWHVDYGDHPGKRSANQSYVKNEFPVDFN